MIKNILVPLDYSEASLNALEWVIHIAQMHNATLHIVHVKDTILGQTDHHLPDKATEFYNAMAGNLGIKYGLKTDVTFAEGIVGHVIVKTIFEKKTDMVILGSHGESGHRDYFIGSNAYYVIKRATCPVLLIPEAKKWKEFEKILFPVRPALLSSKLHHFIYELVRYNARKCTLHLLDVNANKKASEQWQSEIVSELNSKELANKIEVNFSLNINPDIAKSVLSVAKHSKADLLVISPGVDVATSPFFVGPFSQRIINHSRIPVLSILRSSENQ